MATHSFSCLGNPKVREAWWGTTQSMGSQRVRCNHARMHKAETWKLHCRENTVMLPGRTWRRIHDQHPDSTASWSPLQSHLAAKCSCKTEGDPPREQAACVSRNWTEPGFVGLSPRPEDSLSISNLRLPSLRQASTYWLYSTTSWLWPTSYKGLCNSSPPPCPPPGPLEGAHQGHPPATMATCHLSAFSISDAKDSYVCAKVTAAHRPPSVTLHGCWNPEARVGDLLT